MKKEYRIKLNNTLILVTEEVYREYQRPVWREKKQRAVRQNKEISLDSMTERGRDIVDTVLPEELIADKLLLDELLSALAELTDDERFLIDQLFYKEKSERQLSKETNVPQKTINNRKQAIFKKLRKFL